MKKTNELSFADSEILFEDLSDRLNEIEYPSKLRVCVDEHSEKVPCVSFDIVDEDYKTLLKDLDSVSLSIRQVRCLIGYLTNIVEHYK